MKGEKARTKSEEAASNRRAGGHLNDAELHDISIRSRRYLANDGGRRCARLAFSAAIHYRAPTGANVGRMVANGRAMAHAQDYQSRASISRREVRRSRFVRIRGSL